MVPVDGDAGAQSQRSHVREDAFGPYPAVSVAFVPSAVHSADSGKLCLRELLSDHLIRRKGGFYGGQQRERDIQSR